MDDDKWLPPYMREYDKYLATEDKKAEESIAHRYCKNCGDDVFISTDTHCRGCGKEFDRKDKTKLTHRCEVPYRTKI